MQITANLEGKLGSRIGGGGTGPPRTNQSIEAFGFLNLKLYAFWFIIQQSLNLRICLFNTFHSKSHCRQKSI